MRVALCIFIAIFLTAPAYSGDPASFIRKTLPQISLPKPGTPPDQLAKDAENNLRNAMKSGLVPVPAADDLERATKAAADALGDKARHDFGVAAKAAGDVAQEGLKLPIDIPKEGFKLGEEAAALLFKQVTDILEKAINDLKAKVEKFIGDEKAKLWAEVKPYLYLAAAGFLAILLLPAFLSSLFTVLIIRLLDRRRPTHLKSTDRTY